MADPNNIEDMLEKVTREKMYIPFYHAICASIGENYLRRTPEEMSRLPANLVRFAGSIMDDLMKIAEEKWREGAGSIDHYRVEALGESISNVRNENAGLLTDYLRGEVEVVEEAGSRFEDQGAPNGGVEERVEVKGEAELDNENAGGSTSDLQEGVEVGVDAGLDVEIQVYGDEARSNQSVEQSESEHSDDEYSDDFEIIGMHIKQSPDHEEASKASTVKYEGKTIGFLHDFVPCDTAWRDKDVAQKQKESLIRGLLKAVWHGAIGMQHPGFGGRSINRIGYLPISSRQPDYTLSGWVSIKIDGQNAYRFRPDIVDKKSVSWSLFSGFLTCRLAPLIPTGTPRSVLASIIEGYRKARAIRSCDPEKQDEQRVKERKSARYKYMAKKRGELFDESPFAQHPLAYKLKKVFLSPLTAQGRIARNEDFPWKYGHKEADYYTKIELGKVPENVYYVQEVDWLQPNVEVKLRGGKSAFQKLNDEALAALKRPAVRMPLVRIPQSYSAKQAPDGGQDLTRLKIDKDENLLGGLDKEDRYVKVALGDMKLRMSPPYRPYLTRIEATLAANSNPNPNADAHTNIPLNASSSGPARLCGISSSSITPAKRPSTSSTTVVNPKGNKKPHTDNRKMAEICKGR